MQDWGTSPRHLASLGPPGLLPGPLPACSGPWAVPPQLVRGWAPPFLRVFHCRSLLPLLPTVARQGRATGVMLGASGTPRACPQSSDGPLVWPRGILRETSHVQIQVPECCCGSSWGAHPTCSPCSPLTPCSALRTPSLWPPRSSETLPTQPRRAWHSA